MSLIGMINRSCMKDMMWEHTGKCTRGRRSYLFHSCPRCLKVDAEVKEEAEADSAEGYNETDQPSAESLPELDLDFKYGT